MVATSPGDGAPPTKVQAPQLLKDEFARVRDYYLIAFPRVLECESVG
jgi:hypothetical protein